MHGHQHPDSAHLPNVCFMSCCQGSCCEGLSTLLLLLAGSHLTAFQLSPNGLGYSSSRTICKFRKEGSAYPPPLHALHIASDPSAKPPEAEIRQCKAPSTQQTEFCGSSPSLDMRCDNCDPASMQISVILAQTNGKVIASQEFQGSSLPWVDMRFLRPLPQGRRGWGG